MKPPHSTTHTPIHPSIQETSPVITNRVVESNLAGSVGRPARDTQVKIAHPETGAALPMYVCRGLGWLRFGEGMNLDGMDQGDATQRHPTTHTYTIKKKNNNSGQSGLVMMKGPQAMGGYKANAEASKMAFDAEGFLNTGDLGRINPGTGHLIITGRAKVGCVCVWI